MEGLEKAIEKAKKQRRAISDLSMLQSRVEEERIIRSNNGVTVYLSKEEASGIVDLIQRQVDKRRPPALGDWIRMLFGNPSSARLRIVIHQYPTVLNGGI